MVGSNKDIKDLVACFKKLPRRDLQRLKFHAEAKTAICCGFNAFVYTDGEGGG